MFVYCFLNIVKYIDVEGLRVKFGCMDYYVSVKYCYGVGEFDLMLFILDDFVCELGGEEVF